MSAIRDHSTIMTPHVGMLITPSIRLACLLGRGGMGSVWLADHERLKTRVAVKFLSSDLTEDERLCARFSREATSAARINSPHAVHVYDHGVLDGELPYIVMEYLQGMDLGAHLDTVGPLSEEETTKLLLQLSRVLRKAHGLGIIHRDIKPENVFLVDDYGEFFVKLIDFGIAKLTTSRTNLTKTGSMFGTPAYMSPEQLLSAKDVGPSADYWALAAVLYTALSGLTPFRGDSLPAVCLAVESARFDALHQTYGLGKPSIDRFFSRAFDRDPHRRFRNLEEMVDAWQSAVDPSMTSASTALNVTAVAIHRVTACIHSPTDLTAVWTRSDLPGGGARTAPIETGPWDSGLRALGHSRSGDPMCSVVAEASSPDGDVAEAKVPYRFADRRKEEILQSATPSRLGLWLVGAVIVSLGVLWGAYSLTRSPDSSERPEEKSSQSERQEAPVSSSSSRPSQAESPRDRVNPVSELAEKHRPESPTAGEQSIPSQPDPPPPQGVDQIEPRTAVGTTAPPRVRPSPRMAPLPNPAPKDRGF